MADQATQGPQQSGWATYAGQDDLRLNQEAVPLPPGGDDPLTEAARHFRKLQVQSAGLTEMNIPSRTARERPQDKTPSAASGFSASVETCHQTEPALAADMLSEGGGAAARVTPRLKLRPGTKAQADLGPAGDREFFIGADTAVPNPPGGAPFSSTTKDRQASALSSLVADVRPSRHLPAINALSVDIGTTALPDGGSVDEMRQAMALAAGAPLLASSLTTGEMSPSSGNNADVAAEPTPFPPSDRKRPLPTGPSSNLRLFAGLSVIIAAFAGSLVWVALWRADSFNGRAAATLDVSPEDLVQTSAGDGGTGNGNDGSVTATLMVRDTELLLAKLAFDPGPADGVLDDMTRSAIKRYQQVAGLPETGEPSKELLDELEAVAGAIDGH
jgi:hypothetical protein